MSGTEQGAGGGASPSAPASAPASPSQAPAPSSTPSPPSAAPDGRSAPGGPPDTGPSRQEQMGVPNEVIAVLGYDPFGPVEPAPPQAPPAQPQAPVAPPQPSPQGAVSAAPAAVPSEIEQLKSQVQQLTGALSAMRPSPAAAAGEQQIDPVPAYQYEIPDQLLGMLASEDAGHRKVALSNVMTAVSRSVHGMMQRELAQVIPTLARQVVMQHYAEQEVGKDFYSTYKNLDKPELKPLIYQIATGWAQQNPQAGWNAQTRDAIARVVHQTLNMPFPGQAGNGAAALPPAAPVMMPTMTRPTSSGVMTDEQEMLDLLR